MLVWSNRCSAKARGVLPGCMLPAAVRIRVARALSSRHAITSSVCCRAIWPQTLLSAWFLEGNSRSAIVLNETYGVCENPQLFALCDCRMIKMSLGLVSTSDRAVIARGALAVFQ